MNDRDRALVELDKAVHAVQAAEEQLHGTMRAARQHMSANQVAARVAPVMSRPSALKIVRPAAAPDGTSD
ncbi:hypothetical protein [Nocardia sp. NBC_01327]|uniref:hypothetical protein n=1 Tax=Nocardia sp. NBC_01327 TaxID=2903593 RepID=UPI002E12B35C|nr:hypothetical protein OG326_23645 [Nocardia sp. NBC_01327]